MGVEGGVVSLTNAGRTRDSRSGLCINRSDVPAGVNRRESYCINRSDLVTTLFGCNGRILKTQQFEMSELLISPLISTGRGSPPRMPVAF